MEINAQDAESVFLLLSRGEEEPAAAIARAKSGEAGFRAGGTQQTSKSIQGTDNQLDNQPWTHELSLLVEEIRSWIDLPCSDLAEQLTFRLKSRSYHYQELALFRLLSHKVASSEMLAIEIVEQYLDREQLGSSQLITVRLYALVLRAYFVQSKGNYRQAIQLLENVLLELRNSGPSAFSDYALSNALVHLGSCYQQAGNFLQAELHFLEALKIAEHRGFFGRWYVEKALGELLWASGQYMGALERHRNPLARAAAKRSSNWSFLIRSNLDAAKCYIDMKATDKARSEIDEARELLTEHPDPTGVLEGYLLLFSGELETQLGNVEEALDLLSSAVDHFEELDPSHCSGVMSAKIALCHFALFEQDYSTAWKIICKLHAEAEHRCCTEAKGRLLLLESFFFLTEKPPEELRFGDLLSRLHLINNPVLQFHALANLYTFALEFLGERHQTFLLARIRNLNEKLKASTYRDLYRTFVSQRYEFAIENRLARFAEQEGVEEIWQSIDEY